LATRAWGWCGEVCLVFALVLFTQSPPESLAHARRRKADTALLSPFFFLRRPGQSPVSYASTLAKKLLPSGLRERTQRFCVAARPKGLTAQSAGWRLCDTDHCR
jgi:hypothetical protein